MTNRDLYGAIGELGERYARGTRSLEEYLLALLGLAHESHRGRAPSALSVSGFYRLLSEAFTADPLPFDATWRDTYGTLGSGMPGFAGWEATLIQQIVDLREMEETGTLNNEDRHFGVTSPRGSSWYNFDPEGYLECAVEGSLGG